MRFKQGLVLGLYLIIVATVAQAAAPTEKDLRREREALSLRINSYQRQIALDEMRIVEINGILKYKVLEQLDKDKAEESAKKDMPKEEDKIFVNDPVNHPEDFVVDGQVVEEGGKDERQESEKN